MEHWTEQTSLRLLELIASISIAAPADRDARATAVIEVLASLAESDPHFRDWLRSGVQSCHAASSSTTEFNWHRVAEDWLSWLAAEPLDVPALAGTSSGSGDCAIERERSSLYRRVLIANARVALRSLALVAECEKGRQEMARELAYDMAYGLSHELNNPLANIAARARLLAEDEASEHKRQLLAAIVDQAMRGCEMIADGMLIARPPVLKLEPVELSSVVRETVARAQPWAAARALSLVVHLGDQAQVVSSDRAALAEALWALLRNALEVARHEITLTVSTSSSSSSSPAGDGTVMLSIQDDGPGISSHALSHAFNPYFSGREAGRGLGVGLAKADRIARLSGGRVTLATADEGGCIARLALPSVSK